MQKRHSKQSKERSDKGKRDMCEFRVVSIPDEIVEKKSKKNPSQPKQKLSPPLKSNRPLCFYLLT